jgi:DNA-directed RNA polymerase
MSAISKAVREGFVRLYEEHCPLWSFRAAALAQVMEDHRLELPGPPQPGDFDVRKVLRSKYFFA